MNFDMKKYQELGLNELGMNEEQAKAYRARVIATTQGWHDSAPVDPDAERVRVGIVYNPITRRYAADYHTEGLEFGSRDELGDALLDCDDLSEPDPDKLISYPEPTTSEDEEEEADKKRKKKLKTKKKKKKKTIQAPKLEEPKDIPSSPTRSKTLAYNNLDPVIHPSASGTQLQPRVKRSLLRGVMRRCCKHCRPLLKDLAEDDEEEGDKKRKKKMKTKKPRKKKKIQAPNPEEPKDNTSSPKTMRSDLIEALADKNLDPSASAASGSKPEAEG